MPLFYICSLIVFISSPILLLAQVATDSTSTHSDSIRLSFSFDPNILIVTGQSIPTDLQSSVLPTTVITKQMITQRAATNVLEILQQEPSIRIQRDGVLGTFITMNGLDGKHIKILIDGVPMIGRSDGNLDLERIPVQNIERIEIVENALSVAYGTDALGGTINIITYQAQKQQWTANIVSQLQSNNTFNNSIALGMQWKNWQLDLYYQHHDFGGFSTDTFRSQTWNPKQQHAADAKLTYTSTNKLWRIGYQFNYLNETINNRGNIRLDNFPTLSYAQDYLFTTRTLNHQLVSNGFLSKSKKYYLNATLSFNDFDRQKNSYFRSLNENESPDLLDTLDSDTTGFQAWNLRASIASKYYKKINFQLGTDIRYDYTTGGRIANQFSVLGDYAIFGTLDYQPISSIKISLGTRLAYNTLGRTPFTYSLGAKWKIQNGMQLRFSYARGIRMPSLKELYLDFVDVSHYIQGNPDLQPEYAHNLRLKWNWNKVYPQNHLVRLEASAFYNYINQQINLFSYELDDQGNFIPSISSNQYAYFNLDKYQNWGIDAAVKYQTGGLTIRLGALTTANYNLAHESAPKEVKPFTYTLELSQEVSYHFKKAAFTLSIFRRDYDQLIRYTVLTSPITQEPEIIQGSIDGYALLDWTMTKSFWKNGLQLSGGIKNILNTQNIGQSSLGSTHSGTDSSLPIAMGRIFFIKIAVNPFAIQQAFKK